MAFSVHLTDAPAENDIASCDQMSDAYRLYRGVFEQVSADGVKALSTSSIVPLLGYDSVPVSVPRENNCSPIERRVP